MRPDEDGHLRGRIIDGKSNQNDILFIHSPQKKASKLHEIFKTLPVSVVSTQCINSLPEMQFGPAKICKMVEKNETLPGHRFKLKGYANDIKVFSPQRELIKTKHYRFRDE